LFSELNFSFFSEVSLLPNFRHQHQPNWQKLHTPNLSLSTVDLTWHEPIGALDILPLLLQANPLPTLRTHFFSERTKNPRKESEVNQEGRMAVLGLSTAFSPPR
jgi:hypothetical protein